MRHLIFIILLFPWPTLAQKYSGVRDIHWNPVKKFTSASGEVIFYLNFHKAFYKNLNTLIPYYYELIKIGNSQKYQVELLNQEFEQFDYKEINNISSLNNLSSDIEIETAIVYIRKIPYQAISFIPLRKNPRTNRIERLVRFSLSLRPEANLKSTLQTPAGNRYTDHSVLKSGSWIKIKVTFNGIYQLTYDELLNLGIDNPANVRIYGNGGGMLSALNINQCIDDLVENPIWFEKGSDGIFNSGDYILFYGQEANIWQYDQTSNFYQQILHKFSDGSYYFLTSDLGKGKEIQTELPPSGIVNTIITEFDDHYHYEKEDRNLIHSGNEWYGEKFDVVTIQDFAFTIHNPITSEPVRAKINLLSRAPSTTSFIIYANSQYLGSISIPETNLSLYTATYAHSESDTFRFYINDENVEIRLQYDKKTASAQGWLDYITLNARRKIQMVNSQLQFRDCRSIGPGNISEFRISGVTSPLQVWDITDPTTPLALTANQSGSIVSFTCRTDSLKEFIAFTQDGEFLKPLMEGNDVGPIENQDLHGLDPVDYIIISHPDFIEQARRLAAFRYDHDQLNNAVVTPQQIYHEFSSGKPDIAALRNFVKMFYDRASTENEMPKYLLLFGDGSFDNKTISENNTNYILTYQSNNSLSPVSSFLTDDYFGLLDEDEEIASGAVDIGIGRFPVSSAQEAESVVDKTISYDQPDKMGDWRNSLCFIGDDEDGNLHMSQADELAQYVENHYPFFVISKIFLDAYPQISTPSGQRYPDVNEAINQRITKGALIINYTGHGGANGLAHERIIGINDIVSWQNQDKLPLFMTATCEFSRFDDYEETSAGELALLNPDGGGIALLTTTRLVYSGPNHVLNEHFYEIVFEKDDNNQNYRLGDIIRLTKNATGPGTNKRNFTLLGDPAVMLAYPKYKIKTTAINGVNITEYVDTLKALRKVSISGQIEDEKGSLLSDFNGILYPTIFDKSIVLNTLGNDGGQPFPFNLQNRILYKGKSSVRNGQFTFNFVVPKDISYNYGHGRLSYYANNRSSDASGSFREVIIGGSADPIVDDNIGPQIEIFMNDENFVFGGITDENPRLLIHVSDSNGINTIGSGIGHDITAVLDNNAKSPIVLNEYYEADMDSYKSGKISYPFRELSEGRHNLQVKVWDVYNNSSEEYLEFVVTSGEDLILKHVLNYPNPFTTRTSFFFEHNYPDGEMDVLIQIFTVSGKLVKTIQQHVTSTGYRSDPIDWDGLDDFGNRIGRGVYIYRIKVRSANGQTVEKFEKLVILR